MVIKKQPNTNNRSITKDEAESIELLMDVSFESSSEEDESEQDSPPHMHSIDISMDNENNDQTESDEWDYNECHFEYEHETEERYPFPDECETFERECGECYSHENCFYWTRKIYRCNPVESTIILMLIQMEKKRACGPRADPNLS
jgi:hypothetical protein